jgi:hypothetical protein
MAGSTGGWIDGWLIDGWLIDEWLDRQVVRHVLA